MMKAWPLSLLIAVALATPPACFLACIGQVSRTCERNHHDLACLCNSKTALFDCMVDNCPYGDFEAGRDHFFGTCLEHGYPGPKPPPYDGDTKIPHVPGHEPHVPVHEPAREPGHTPHPEHPAHPHPDHPVDEHPHPGHPGHAPVVSPVDPDYDPDCDDKDKEEPKEIEYDDDWDLDDCEWEEEHIVDDNGDIVIIRRPLDSNGNYKKAHEHYAR